MAKIAMTLAYEKAFQNYPNDVNTQHPPKWKWGAKLDYILTNKDEAKDILVVGHLNVPVMIVKLSTSLMSGAPVGWYNYYK